MISAWSGGHVGSVMWALLVATLVAGSAAELPTLHCRHEGCRYIGNSNGDELYEVEGHIIMFSKLPYIGDSLTMFEWLTIYCKGTSVLESPALPRFEPAPQLQALELSDCTLPGTRSLADTLATLNVVMTKEDSTLLLYNVKVASTLASKHFAGLDYLDTLYIEAVMPVSSERGFLASLRNLRALVMRNVTLHASELEALPPSLHYLELHDAGVDRLSDAIRLLVNLTVLTISSKSPLDAGVVPPGLRELELQSPATTLRLDVAPALETLSMDNWTAPLPPPLARCDKLREVHLTAPAMRALPEGWLANCSRLKELVIENARNLTTLPPTLLPRLYTLTRLALRQGALESLPERLLYGVGTIESLELDGNRLQTLPRNIFMSLVSVVSLNLSANDLDGAVRDVLRPILNSRLIVLDLSHNPRIGDLCNANNNSPFYSPFASSRTKLLLSGTGVTRICLDWRLHLSDLKTLDLSDTNVTELSVNDLLFTRHVLADVWLLGAPVATVRATHKDYNDIYAAAMPTSITTVHVDAEFECDCRMYWVRRALDLPALAGVQLRCVDGGLLRDVPPGDMVCARREVCAEAALPDVCACATWADDDPDHDRRLVRVRCENASLALVPRFRASPDRLYELLLANNRITHLDADDLQGNINGFDLRNNSLMQVDKETARKLGYISGMVQLAGNPLECNCSAAPLLRALHNRARNTTDLYTATCRNGSSLYAALIEDCPQSAAPTDSDTEVLLVAWLAGTLAVLLAFALAATAWLASRERRFFARAVLHRWGFVWRATEPVADGARRYDAFLTFSHKDEDVARKLLARLEPAYRLCVHHRDWTPGCFISEQVVESVRESRRTVALVSRHFLQSSWALAEFREAHTAAMLDAWPRLVVVLLEEPHTLQMDAQLRRYVTTHTYLRWGEPFFWEKMKLALPPPRPAPQPTSCNHDEIQP